jgi:hypothetical protein
MAGKIHEDHFPLERGNSVEGAAHWWLLAGVTAGTDGVVEKSSDEVLQFQDGVRGGPQHTDKHEKVPMGWLTRKGSGGSVVVNTKPCRVR